mmetsp:Transcript_8167/g.33097  ORF Transcript_8167/g.33097 Transcript_8167/m.33097 type:complete len:225 (+) Transcript_8167:3349-4023(+)
MVRAPRALERCRVGEQLCRVPEKRQRVRMRRRWLGCDVAHRSIARLRFAHAAAAQVHVIVTVGHIGAVEALVWELIVWVPSVRPPSPRECISVAHATVIVGLAAVCDAIAARAGHGEHRRIGGFVTLAAQVDAERPIRLACAVRAAGVKRLVPREQAIAASVIYRAAERHAITALACGVVAGADAARVQASRVVGRIAGEDEAQPDSCHARIVLEVVIDKAAAS